MSKSEHWKTALGKDFLSADDVPKGQDVPITIKSATMDFVSDPNFKVNPKGEVGAKFTYKGKEYENTENGWKLKKLVVHFEESPLSLIVNVTNARSISKIAGNRYTKWAGAKIILHNSIAKVAGKTVDCIRIR